MSDKASWSPWYYGVSHLCVGRNVATINRFEDGSCTVWIYNRDQDNLFSNSAQQTTYHKSTDEAMKIAERRFAVKGNRPMAAFPVDHPANPKFD